MEWHVCRRSNPLTRILPNAGYQCKTTDLLCPTDKAKGNKIVNKRVHESFNALSSHAYWHSHLISYADVSLYRFCFLHIPYFMKMENSLLLRDVMLVYYFWDMCTGYRFPSKGVPCWSCPGRYPQRSPKAVWHAYARGLSTTTTHGRLTGNLESAESTMQCDVSAHPLHVLLLRLRGQIRYTNTLHRHLLITISPTKHIRKSTLIVLSRVVALNTAEDERAREDIVLDRDLQREPLELNPCTVR